MSDPKVNILLVDDRPENLIALESVLSELDQNLVKASSGSEALKHLLHQDFAVILMDVQMPELDGFETARLIRAREKTQHIPIVFLTAINKSEDHVSHGYSVGAVDYVFKPFSPGILKAKVSTFVELSKKTQELQREIRQRQEAEAQVRKLNSRLERRVRERTSELESANRELEQEIVERKKAEEERLVSLEQERQARADAEAAQARLSFLGEASAVLAGSLDYQTTLETISRLPVPDLADYCVVDLLGDEGELQRVASTHRDPVLAQVLNELRAHTIPRDSELPPARAVRSGRSELHSHLDVERILVGQATPERQRAARELAPCSLISVPLVARGNTMGVVTLVAASSGRHFTARDQAMAEDLGRRAASALENARLFWQLQEAARRKDEFLAMLAHELRNPLSAISNAGHILEETEAANERSRQLRTIINRQAEHLSRLVDDLLDTARITRGKIELRKGPIELASVVQRAIETSSSLVQACGHELQVSIPDDTVWLDADPTRIEQVLWNLLNNAAKYTEPGGKIRLTAELADGSPGGNRSAERQVIIRVRDTGIGIAPELVGHVFDLFTQADRSLDRSQGGLGIGLALVRNLVHLHGGAVSCQSEGVGKGSEFTVMLPVLEGAPKASDLPAPEPVPSRPAGSEEPARHRVLIIEDNLDAAETLNDLLELWGHEVRVAINGAMGLDAAATYRPDVVLLDIGLPGMNGYEVAKHLRELPETRSALILALTGYGHEDDRRRSREAGFDHHLTKPVDPAELQEILATTHLPAPGPATPPPANGNGNGNGKHGNTPATKKRERRPQAARLG